LDSDGNRLVAKYCQAPHASASAPNNHHHTALIPPQLNAKNPFSTYKEQRSFEKAIYEKTRKASGGFFLADLLSVVYGLLLGAG
jgi:hypothetical protein